MGLGSATWTLDSRSILLGSANALWLLEAGGQKFGNMTKLRDGTFSNLVTDIAGRRYAFNRTITDANIWQLDVATQRQSQLISSSEEDSEPDFSPDGSRILFRSARTGHFELYVCNRDGNGVRQITHLASHCGSARWSPDGKWIAYDSVQDFPGPGGVRKFDNIYVIPSEGGAPRRLTDDQDGSVVPNWSADSQWVYFSRGKQQQGWKVPLKGGAPVIVDSLDMFGAVENSDGRWIYYEQPATGKGLWRRPVAGGSGEPIPGTENLEYRAWELRRGFLVFLRSAQRPDSAPPMLARTLFVKPPGSVVRASLKSASNPGFFRIDLTNDKISAPRFVGPPPRRLLMGPGVMSVSPDAKTILYTSVDLTIGDIYAVYPAATKQP
jgi:dipeptidyl aminopeptidase/acylaminoacyl peptidase